MNLNSTAKRKRRRPMIAVLIHYIERSSGGYEQVLRRAFVTACRQHDLDFVLVCGSELDAPSPELRVHNQIYNLVSAEHFDGVILVPAGICAYSGTDGLLTRLANLEGLPICSLGLVLPEVPSIVADNGVGMSAAVEHLIVHHGRRNLAFVGNEWDNFDCNQRRDVFVEVARRHGLQVPAHRMLTCWLEPSSAEAAVLGLIEQDPSIDGIVAVNDGSAVGALHALQQRGRLVPEQVAVTGYDNLPMAQLVQPSLTSVSQPLAQMATAAVESIVQQLAGKRPALLTSLPSSLVIRHSCGCNTASTQAQSLKELTETSQRAFEQGLQLESTYGQILEMARRFSLTVDRSELERLVSEQLPLLHPLDCFIGLYPDEHRDRFRLILPQRFASDYSTLPADASFLSQLGNPERPRALLMMGLAFRAELFGVVGFELGGAGFDYPAIRDHLASAWQVITLREEVVRQTTLTERSQQERQAAADRSRAMSAMAGGVAHDLNNALGALVSLSDVVCDEIEEHRKTGSPLNPETTDDLRAIKSSALRATETIKDLMTLARIRRTHHEPFDLVRLTQGIVEDQRSKLAKEHASTIILNFEVSRQDLIITGSEAHVERAISNVLRNAAEAVSQGGRIDVSVSTRVLDRTLQGYESISPGSYAVVRISDTGPGIDARSLKRLFEPFFSTKRLGESSGSGLGLAIVHSVVKEHHGFVDVESEPGCGSRFMLFFPKAGSISKARPSQAPVVGGSARILVVDDDLTQLRTAKRVLSRCGYDVTTIASGARAYELIAAEASSAVGSLRPLDRQAASPASPQPSTSSYDLVILDLALNEEDDGLEIYNKIRRIFPGQKGILASGHAFVDHEDQIRAANLVWLPKPYTIESLTTAIRAALRE